MIINELYKKYYANAKDKKKKTNINLYIYMGGKIYMNKGRRRRFICIENIAMLLYFVLLFKFYGGKNVTPFD